MGMAHCIERYWTAEDVRALPEDGDRYECVDGVLLVTPAPSALHQIACSRMVRLLDPFIERNALGDLLWSPADIELEPRMLVQPDLFVTLGGAKNPPRVWSGITGLLLAIEVLSPSTARRDRGMKRELYQRAGVREYWIVDLDARCIERWTPTDEYPEVLRDNLRWAPDGASDVLEIDLPSFFARMLDV